jgi:uncharacterized membrane protein
MVDRFAAGAELVSALEAHHFQLRDALWLYLPELSDWQLWLSSPTLNTTGPAGAYSELGRIARRADIAGIDLSDVVIVDPGNPLLQLLRSAIGTGPNIGGIRFSRNTINGTFIEDAYIYKLQ